MDWKVIIMAAAIAGGHAAQEGAAACSVSIDFQSFCCGIDRKAYEDAKAFADSSPLVTGQSERAYGMEGERVLCLNARNAADAQKLGGELKTLFAGRKLRAPVKVR
jgi:hypothetical protein